MAGLIEAAHLCVFVEQFQHARHERHGAPPSPNGFLKPNSLIHGARGRTRTGMTD